MNCLASAYLKKQPCSLPSSISISAMTLRFQARLASCPAYAGPGPLLPMHCTASCTAASRVAFSCLVLAPLASAFEIAMAAPQTAQEALRAWLNLLPPEERRAAQSKMGATLPASAEASDEHTHVAAPDEPTPTPSQADPSTTPIPEEPNPILLAQREWYDSQDKIFQGPIPPETPWQDDDLSAQPSSSASPQPMVNETSASPQAPDQEPWLLPKPDTCLFNIFGESFQLQALKEKIAKGQMPHCLFKDPAAVDQQPLNRQEMWAAMQYKPIYRTAGRWTYCRTTSASLRLNFVMRLRTRPNSRPPPAFSLKKRPDPSMCLPLLAPACRPNRLRRTPSKMQQKKRRPPSLPPPPSPNQPRSPRLLRYDRFNSAACGLYSRAKTRAPTPEGIRATAQTHAH